MRVVVDLGCLPRNGARSLQVLAKEYEPDHIYGFDPGLKRNSQTTVRRIPTTLRRAAAWIFDGTVPFHEDGSGSRIGFGQWEAPCIDFAAWLRDLEADEVFLKMDIEGAEVAVLQSMIENGTDRRVSELLVEWHGVGQELEGKLACPVRQWWL